MDLVRSKTLVLWNLILIRLINISFLMISTDFKLSLPKYHKNVYLYKKNPLDLYSSPFVNIYFSLYLIIKKLPKIFEYGIISNSSLIMRWRAESRSTINHRSLHFCNLERLHYTSYAIH